MEEGLQPGGREGQGDQVQVVPGLWHEGHVARGFTTARSVLQHYQVLFWHQET